MPSSHKAHLLITRSLRLSLTRALLGGRLLIVIEKSVFASNKTERRRYSFTFNAVIECRDCMTSGWENKRYRRICTDTKILVIVFLRHEAIPTSRVHGSYEQAFKAAAFNRIGRFRKYFQACVIWKCVCVWEGGGLARKPLRCASGSWVFWISVIAKVVERVFCESTDVKNKG